MSRFASTMEINLESAKSLLKFRTQIVKVAKVEQRIIELAELKTLFENHITSFAQHCI